MTTPTLSPEQITNLADPAPTLLAPKAEVPYPLPSSWITPSGKLYVLLDYYYPGTEALVNLKPEGVLVYSVRTEKRMVVPIAEFIERVNTGSFNRVTDLK